MRNHPAWRLRILLVALISLVVFQRGSAGEEPRSIPASTNLAVIQGLINEVTVDIAGRAHIRPGDSVRVHVLPSGESWIVENAMIAALKASGCSVFLHTDSLAGDDVEVENAGIEMGVLYTDMFRDGVLGTRKMKRAVSVGLSSRITRAKTNEVLFSGHVTRTLSDTVIVDDLRSIETEGIKSTHGEMPPEGFFDRILEPFVIIGATGVAVFLFFHVRG